MATHVVMFSGGVGSWATAKRVAQAYGTENLILLFADTQIEDEDLYRFIKDAARNVGGHLISIADGRDPWEVFRDERFIGNSRADPCSKHLKRVALRRWLNENCSPEDTEVYLGIDWTEEHRFVAARDRWTPWRCHAPLCEPPLRMKEELLAALLREGLQPPRLYGMGFPHNNCGGFCIKAGQAHFKLLLETMPHRYAEHERKEQELALHLGKPVSILRDRKGGKTTPLTLRQFRERVQKGMAVDAFEWGGCGCLA